MSWDYLQAHRYRTTKHGKVEVEKWRQEMRDRGVTLVTHSLINCFPDEEGNSTFDRIIIRNFDTNEWIATFEDDDIEQANQHYMDGNFWHAECYVP